MSQTQWISTTSLADLQPLLILLALTYLAISFLFLRAGLALMIVSTIFSPEIVVGSMGQKQIALRLEDFLILILILAWVGRNALRLERTLLQASPVNKPILCLLALSVISTSYGYATGWVPPFQAMFYFGKTLEFFAIFFLVLNFIRTEKMIHYFLFFALLTVGLLALYLLPQVPRVEMFTERRITAPFEGAPEPSTAGGYMAFFLVILVSLFLHADRPEKKWGIGLVGILVFIPFLFSLSRISYAAFLAGILVIAFVGKRKGLRFLVIALLLASPWLLPEKVMDRITFTWEDAKNPYRDLGVDYSFQERIYAFLRSWNDAKESPIIGLGIASWEYPDNQYARTLHELGFLGIAFWLWIYWRLYRIGLWLHGTMPPGLLKGLALGYSAGIVGILLHAFGSSTFYVVRIMEPFWFISGLVVSLYLIRVRKMAAVARIEDQEEFAAAPSGELSLP